MPHQKDKKKVNPKKELHQRNSRESTAMYFRIDSPISLRRDILKAAIDVTMVQKRYEAFRGLNHLKSEAHHDFLKIYHELDSLVKKLGKKDLPVIPRVRQDIGKVKHAEEKLSDMKQHETQERKIEISTEQKNSDMPSTESRKHYLSEDERLDQELREIQNRLRNLEV